MPLLPEKNPKMSALAPRGSTNSHPLSPCHLNLGFLRLDLGVTSGHHDSNLHPTIAAVQLHIAAHQATLRVLFGSGRTCCSLPRRRARLPVSMRKGPYQLLPFNKRWWDIEVSHVSQVWELASHPYQQEPHRKADFNAKPTI